MQTESTTKKKPDIVRTWITSTLLDAADSRQRQLNPDYHPPIHQARDGTFYNEQMRVISRKHVPEYILADADNIPQDAPKKEQERLSLAEAMQRSGVATTPGGQILR